MTKQNNRLLLVTGAVGIWALATLMQMPAEGHIRIDLPACPTEDSINCYWNADHMGNGTGSSFYNINGTVYLEQKP